MTTVLENGWILEDATESPPERTIEGGWILEPTPSLAERLRKTVVGAPPTEQTAEAYRKEAEKGVQGGVEVTPGLTRSFRQAATAIDRTTLPQPTFAGPPVVPPVVTPVAPKPLPLIIPVLPGFSPAQSDVVKSTVAEAARVATSPLAEAERAGRVPTREAAGLPRAYPGEAEGFKPESIAAAPSRERGYLERALTSAGLLEPSEVERRRSARLMADVGQRPPEAPTALGRAIKVGLGVAAQIPTGAAESATLGLLPAVARAYGLKVPEAETSLEQVAKGFGGLVGFIRGPAVAAGRAAFEGFLEPLAKDAIGKILAKQIAREAAVLASASGVSAMGQALEQPKAKEAIRTIGEATKSGAIMGTVFAGVPGIVAGRTAFQTAARAGLGMALLDIADGRRPWDERDVAQKAFDYGLDAYFLFMGRDPRVIQAALRQAGQPSGASPESVLRVAFYQSEADRGLRTQQEVADERARVIGAKPEIAPSEAAVPQPEAMPGAAEAGLARREIPPPEAPREVPPDIKAAAPEIKALVDQFQRPAEVPQVEAVPSGPLRTAREIAGAPPEPVIPPAERQAADRAKLAAEVEARRYQDVPSTFYEFARERGRWPIAPSDPGYMALRREWDEIRRPLYEIQGPRLGQWEVVNRITNEVETQAPNRAMAQLQANKMDRARMRPMPPEQFRPLPPFQPVESPVSPPAEAERPEPERLVTPSVTPEARPEVPRPIPPVPTAPPPRQAKPEKVRPLADVLGGEPEGFDPNDVDQLAKFVVMHGGIAPSPTGDLKGEYAAIPLRFKNRKGLNPDLMGQAVSEAAGRTVADYEVLQTLSHLGRLRQDKAARLAAEATAPAREAEREQERANLAALPEEEKVRRIAAMTGRTEAEALKIVQRPEKPEFLTSEMERAERDVAELQIAARDYYGYIGPDDPATPEVLDKPFFERFGGAERITNDLFDGNRDLVTAALETAKQDVAEGRVQEERAAYGRAFGEEPPKYERTAEGEQAVVPGAEARQIPTTPLRAARPQRPVQETPLFAEGEQAEQPRLPGVEERRQPYGGGDITRPTRFFHGTSGEELTTFRPGLIYMAPDPENASVFAANPILNRGRANPRVLAVEAQPGRVKDISRAVDDAVMERTDLDVDATVSQESQIARREGYRYVAFDHPGIGEDFRAVVSLYPDSDLGVNAIARSKEKSAPATFLGYQESVGGAAPIPLYQLTEPIGKHPKDDTLSRDTLRALGVEPPEPPPFEEWQRTRGVEERRPGQRVTPNEEQLGRVAEAYRAGQSMQQIADTEGVASSTVMEWLRRRGVASRQRGPDDDIMQRALDLYRSGLPTGDVAEQLGVSRQTIANWLHSVGEPLRREKRIPLDQAVRDEIARLYTDEELSISGVARKLGVSPGTVAKVVASADIGRTISEGAAIAKSRRNYTGPRGVSSPWQSAKTGEWSFADSSYELVRMSQLDSDPSVTYWRRNSLRVTYGDGRTYIPDLYVEFADGHRIVEEIKPTWRLSDEDVQAKAAAAKEQLAERGITYRLVTEDEIGRDAIKAFDLSAIPNINQEAKLERQRDLEALRRQERQEQINTQARERYAKRKRAVAQTNVAQTDITPAMRRSVMEEGQALFEGRKEYTFRDDANDTQRANADAIVARLTGPLGGLSHPGVPVGLPAISGLGTPAAGGPHAVPGGRGGAGLEESRPALKEGAGVRVLGAKIGGELARRGRVTFAGQRIETEEDLARIGQIASDPQIESFRVIPVKDGIALPDSVLSARLPGTAPVFLDFSPEQARRIADNQITDIRQLPRPVWETLERLKRLGADGYWLLHNHPSGTPLPSHADLAVTDLFRKAVPGFQGHVVIDSKAYGTIRTDSSGELRRYVEPAKFAVRSTEPIRESSFLGRQLANADQLAQLGVEASKEAVGGVIIYQGADGTVSAVEDAPYRFLAGPNVRDHLLARMPEYGSQSVFVYLPRENGPIVDALDPLVKQGLIRDFIVQGTPSASQAMTGAEQVGAENAYRRLMQRFSRERQYRVHEERAPYTDPSLLRDLTDYGQEVRRTKRDFDSWADAMRKEFGERVEPHLGKAWDEMRRTTRASTTEAGAPVEVQVDKASPPPVVGMTQPQLILQRHKQTVEGAAETLLANQGIVRDKTILLSDQILDMMVAGKLNLEAIERVLPEGMTVAEFGQDLWRPAISDAARRLQVLSVLERRINKLLVDGKVPESAREEMDQTLRLAREIDEGVVMQAWWRRLDNVRRGMLVTQLATAIRNFESQVGRLGMDVLDLGLQRGIQKMTGTTPTANPWEAIRAFTEVFKQFKPEEFKRLKGETDQILEAFPRQLDRLFGTYLSDVMAQAHDRATEKARAEMGPIGRGTDTALTGAERVVDLLNIANKGQEFIVRRAVFQAHLDDVLTRRGMDLSDLVSKGETGKIPEDAIKESVAKALELTFATPPTYGTAAWHFVKLMNLGAPLTTSILPFPRFMTNALRFQYEFSPFGFLPVIKHLVSASDRKAILAGDSKAISRATIGSAMFLSAYLLRLLQDDDNKWYELSVPGVDRPVDVRPFNPFASYLFIAELTKRMFKGTLYDKLDWNEILQGVASANLRAGTGLYALEQAIAGIGELDNLKKAKEFGSRALGEYLAGFLMPFQQVKDFLAPFVTDFAEVKDRSLDPFSAPLRDRLPGLVALGLADPLPPAYSPTRAEPIQREAPVLRQTTGVTLSQEKNPAEKELAKFQFSRKEILPKSGDPMFDNLWAKHMGQLVEERLVPYVDSESYQGLADGAKMKRLKDRLIPLRAIAKARTTREMRQMGEGERLKAIKDEATPRRERMYREERRQQREDIAP